MWSACGVSLLSSGFEEKQLIVVKAGHWKMDSFGPKEGETSPKNTFFDQLQSTQLLKDLDMFSHLFQQRNHLIRRMAGFEPKVSSVMQLMGFRGCVMQGSF